MQTPKLGQLIEKTDQAERDCVHVAVAPVVAAEALSPGEHVGIQTDGRVGMSDKPIGIVDPFLTHEIQEGGKFWLVLYQNTVTGMRHQWEHPSFGDWSERGDGSPNAEASKRWLLAFSAEWGMDFSEMIDAALNPVVGNYICAQGVELHGAGDLGKDHDLFWHHLGIWKGQQFPEAHREKAVWTCSC